MDKLIKKLRNRQKMTSKALTELFELIEELEKNIDEDISTNVTKNKVEIKAEDCYYDKVGNPDWIYADSKFSLFVEDGYIKIKKIFTIEKEDFYSVNYFINKSHTFNYFERYKDANIVRINFNELVLALEELIQLIFVESEKIDNDAKEFINFCENWKTQDK